MTVPGQNLRGSDRGVLVAVGDQGLPADEARHDLGRDQRGQQHCLQREFVRNLRVHPSDRESSSLTTYWSGSTSSSR